MNELRDVGKQLTEYAELKAEFTAQRGLLDELFPFIYAASKRMSLRAICRWLEDNQRIQISVNAVAKAMRNQEEYWADLVEDVEPAARIFSDAHDIMPVELLSKKELFEHFETAPPTIAAEDPEGIEKEMDEVTDAARILRNRWFSLPEDVRNQCRRHFAFVFVEPEKDQKKGGKRGKGKTAK